MNTAYLLIAHGSRDPRPQTAMNRLAHLVREHLIQGIFQHSASDADPLRQATSVVRPLRRSPVLAAPRETAAQSVAQTVQLSRQTVLRRPGQTLAGLMPIVGTAVLECSPLSLHHQICEFARRAKAAGADCLKLMPIFLMAGVHVMDDIPAEVAAAQRQLNGSLTVQLCDHLGSHPDVYRLLHDRLATLPAAGQLLVAHGSRRPRGNQAVEAVARTLDTSVAYWSVPPDLESQAIALMQQGAQTITIQPYFLFSGGITDAIAHRTEELAERFPKVTFRLLPPLGASAGLADVVVDLVGA